MCALTPEQIIYTVSVMNSHINVRDGEAVLYFCLVEVTYLNVMM